MKQDLGKLFIIVGVLITVLGLMIYFFGNRGFVPGNLPGDIKWQSGNSTVYIPITTMIIASLIITLISYFLRK